MSIVNASPARTKRYVSIRWLPSNWTRLGTSLYSLQDFTTVDIIVGFLPPTWPIIRHNDYFARYRIIRRHGRMWQGRSTRSRSKVTYKNHGWHSSHKTYVTIGTQRTLSMHFGLQKGIWRWQDRSHEKQTYSTCHVSRCTFDSRASKVFWGELHTPRSTQCLDDWEIEREWRLSRLA